MQKLRTLFLACLLAGALSCKDSKSEKSYLPPSTGGINSLMVVMDTELWNSNVGDKVREHFAQPALGLSPEQAIFNITQVPPQIFRGSMSHSRSVLFVEEDSISRAHIKRDVYAEPQRVAVVKGTSHEELISNVDSLAPKAITAFRKLEIEEAQKRFTRSLNKEDALQEKFGIKLTIPSVYSVGKQEDNFVWMDRQIQKGTMNILVYEMPENSFANDSTFVSDIIRMRDSIGEKYIPGPDVPGKQTYMMTEKAFAPYVFPAELNGLKAVEVKGIWEINGYPMAGPFLTYIINDKQHNRKLVLEGFTFAPSTQKRDYMFELEAILKTLQFTDAQ
ncbi:DUF4837 family protein [Allomuricauda sp. d1]|uniref:DUF4837 family protein n=1 Tax=Allomuricauda sp. d1 TaxID=3136725 RepID=UPI0031D1EC46